MCNIVKYVILCLQQTQTVVKPADEGAVAEDGALPLGEEEEVLREQLHGPNSRVTLHISLLHNVIIYISLFYPHVPNLINKFSFQIFMTSSVLSTYRVMLENIHVSLVTKRIAYFADYWKPIVKDHRNKLLFVITLYTGIAP